MLLIPNFGIEGAAIASLIGYMVSDILVIILLMKMKLMVLNHKFVLISVLMAIYIVFWRTFLIEHFVVSLIMSLIVCGIII